MKSCFWKIALLLFFSSLSFTACGDNDDVPLPDIPDKGETPDTPEENKDTVEFIAPTLVMSVEESQLLGNLLTEGSAPTARVKFEVTDEKVIRIENSRLISVGSGEAELKASCNGKDAKLAVWVEDFREPCTILPDKWVKYIWDYTTSPAEIRNLTGRPIVADYGAEWCSGCKMLDPIISRLSKSYDGRALFLKIDLTETDSPGYQILQAMTQTKYEALKPLEKTELPSVVMIPTSPAREPKLHMSASLAEKVLGAFLTEEFNAR